MKRKPKEWGAEALGDLILKKVRNKEMRANLAIAAVRLAEEEEREVIIAFHNMGYAMARGDAQAHSSPSYKEHVNTMVDRAAFYRELSEYIWDRKASRKKGE